MEVIGGKGEQEARVVGGGKCITIRNKTRTRNSWSIERSVLKVT